MSNDLGLDRSGNGNNWTVNNLAYADQMVDSPTNNFCTWNPLQPDIGAVAATRTFSEGNLKITTTATSGGDARVFGTMGMSSGKWYFEWLMTADASSVGSAIGVADEDHSDEMAYYGPHGGGTGGKHYDDGSATYGDEWGIGDIIGVAFNADTNAITFYLNGVSQGEITSAVDGGQDYFPFVWDGSGTPTITGVANFGQDSSFAGNKTAQGNQDGNNIGDFYYTPPNGFLALCTKNLPNVAVVPSEHFNTVLYTGTGSSVAITGVGFQPDLVWGKKRSSPAQNNWLIDAVRGAGVWLASDGTGAEGTEPAGSSFTSDGFTTNNNSLFTYSSGSYVLWNWKANGSGSSNTNGDITSTVSANTDAGFSIVGYTGNGSAGQTIGHGLSKAPEMMLIKNRSDADDWVVYVKTGGVIDETDKLRLNTTMALVDDADAWNDTATTASLFTVDTDNQNNGSGNTHIAYCFHSVDGYSKVGSYTGNGSSDGTFVYTGFRPAYVMTKRFDSTGGWVVANNKADPYNPMNDILQYEGNYAEATYTFYDSLSNGFKLRDSGNNNVSGATYIYLCFAETPFKFSNAR